VVKKTKKKPAARKSARAPAPAKAASARKAGAAKARNDQGAKRRGLWSLRRIWRWGLRGLGAVLLLIVLAVALFDVVNPPITPYMFAESRRLGGVDQAWVPITEIAPAVMRSVVAAEDANFCNHWGFDMAAIRAAIQAGGKRGASTITQQVVKNLYLWQGRSWPRKALEALMTPLQEAIWSKRRILEVYLNVAEFDEGVFGVDAAAHHYFRVGPDQLTARQAALLAAVLPNPKGRSAARPTAMMRKRARQIMDGAATISADGRAACFED